jgi:hypothetical protein
MKLFKHIKKLALGTITVGSTILMAACYGVTDGSFLITDGEVNSGDQLLGRFQKQGKFQRV